MWSISLLTSPLWSSLLPGCFPEEDGSNTGSVGCEGCIGIADDITVHGCTEAECDAHLWKLMEVAQKYGLVFNPKKTQVKAPMVKFFGCLYDES